MERPLPHGGDGGREVDCRGGRAVTERLLPDAYNRLRDCYIRNTLLTIASFSPDGREGRGYRDCRARDTDTLLKMLLGVNDYCTVVSFLAIGRRPEVVHPVFMILSKLHTVVKCTLFGVCDGGWKVYVSEGRAFLECTLFDGGEGRKEDDGCEGRKAIAHTSLNGGEGGREVDGREGPAVT